MGQQRMTSANHANYGGRVNTTAPDILPDTPYVTCWLECEAANDEARDVSLRVTPSVWAEASLEVQRAVQDILAGRPLSSGQDGNGVEIEAGGHDTDTWDLDRYRKGCGH